MIAFTIGIPLAIFAFLLIGAFVGNVSGNANYGLLPGLVAGIAVFALCMKWQKQQHDRLEKQVLTAGCSPEAAFSAVKEALDSTHFRSSYWSTEPLQHNLMLRSVIKFEEMVCGPFGKMLAVSRIIKLIATIERNGESGSKVKLDYHVLSVQGRWTVDEGISKTTEFIRTALMEATVEERMQQHGFEAQAQAIIDSIYAR